MDLINRISEVEKTCLSAIQQASNAAELEAVENQYLSKKGLLSECLKALRDVDASERPKIGARANEAKSKLEEEIGKKRSQFENALLNEKLKSEKIDYSLPSTKEPIGSLHPVTKVIDEIVAIFARLGFDTALGPEAE